MQLQMFEMGIFWVIPMKGPGLYSDTSLSRHSLILTIACYGTFLFQQKSFRKYFSDTPLFRLLLSCILLFRRFFFLAMVIF